MDRIAEIAGASKRTVYNHFESKEVLFQAVMDRFMDEISSLKKIPYDSSRSLEAQLSSFADAKVGIMQDPSWFGLMKVTLTVFIRDPKLAQQTMARAMVGEDTLVTWLKAAKADGKVKFEDAEMAANLFWSIVSGALFWPQLFNDPMPADEIQLLKDELIETFLSRYRA